MSDKPAPVAAAATAEKKPAAADEKKGGKKAGGKLPAVLSKTPVLIGAVMAVEAIALFAGFKVLGGGPRTATAEVALEHDGDAAEAHGEAKGEGKSEGKGEHGGEGKKKPNAAGTVELPVCEIRAPNKKSGRTFLYDVSIFAVAKAAQGDKLKDTFSARDALIKDRIRTIIAELDPEQLSGGSEPGLETLRRQVRFQLDQIAGAGVIEEVLVPRCMPFRTDY